MNCTLLRYLRVAIFIMACQNLHLFGSTIDVCAHVNDADSIAKTSVKEIGDSTSEASVTLEEFVVQGARIVRTPDRIKIFPSKRDKNFASGGMDVLANMHLSEVSINPLNGEAVASDGETIAFFIDFSPASRQQLQEVRPQDIERIDLIRDPEDPRFQNARIVANYVMKKYEYGGYSKWDASQYAPFSNGAYSLYSKFSYKRMTYDISTGMSYHNKGNESGSKQHSVYDFDFGELIRDYHSDTYKSASISPRVSGRIMYNSQNVSVLNSVGFNYSRTNPLRSSGYVDFSDIFQSDKSSSEESLYNKSAVWNGNCYIDLKNNFSISVNGNFAWSDNRNNSLYTLNGQSPIENNISEDIINANGGITVSKSLGQNNINFSAFGGWTRNRLRYISSNSTGVYHREAFGQLNARVNLRFNKLLLNPSVSLSLSSEKMNDVSYLRWLPKAFIPFYLQIFNRSALSGSFEFAIGAPNIAQRSPVIVKQNEIDAVRGNEHIKNYRFYNARIGFGHSFGSWLYTRFESQFTCEDNIIVPVYSSEMSPSGYPMMVRDVQNSGSSYRTSLKASLSGSYFDNKLAVNAAVSANNFAQTGLINRCKWNIFYSINASYYIGDFRVNAYIQPSAKNFSVWNDLKIPMYWYVSASWALHDLFVDLRFINPFRKSYFYEQNIIDAGPYHSERYSYAPDYHQRIKLTLSYSIGYGKKLNRRDEVGTLNGAESIILK